MSKEIVNTINEHEYVKILRQAVAEIQTARTIVARQINSRISSGRHSVISSSAIFSDTIPAPGLFVPVV